MRVVGLDLNSINTSKFDLDDEKLRKTIKKVETFRIQLEMLHKRREAASGAAIARQREINMQRQAKLGEGRPKAQIQPFKVTMVRF